MDEKLEFAEWKKCPACGETAVLDIHVSRDEIENRLVNRIDLQFKCNGCGKESNNKVLIDEIGPITEIDFR